MILALKHPFSEQEVRRVVNRLREMGLHTRVIEGTDHTLVTALGASSEMIPDDLRDHPLVEVVVPAQSAARIHATRPVHLGSNRAVIGDLRVGIIAGPCSVEDRTQLLDTAAAVKEAGAIALRGGAFKPRTDPRSFRGLGAPALELLAEARDLTGLMVVTEVMSVDQVELVARYADVLQIGSRSMHNYNLLCAAGRTNKPILLKRGWSASMDEFLHAAEYILEEGNSQIILCERGIRTFESYVRNTLALALVPALKMRSTLPVIVDPSHGTGSADLVAPMSKAAIACGADGLLIEVHPHPERALSDGAQSLDFAQFAGLMAAVEPVARAVGRAL